jgi:hypothetical protein
MTDALNDLQYKYYSGTVEVGTYLVKNTDSISSYTGTITIPASDTVMKGTLDATVNGIIRAASLTTVAMQDTDSTNLILQDATGGTLWATGTTAESATTHYGTMVIPVDTTMEFVAIAEGTQSGTVKPVFTIHYQR